MNRWKWQALSEIVRALIAKGQYGYACLIMMTVLLVSVAVPVLGVVQVARRIGH